MHAYYNVSWNWIWLLMIAPILWIPLFTRYRLPYLTLVCVALVLATSILWERNRGSDESVGFVFPFTEGNRLINVFSGGGNIGIAFRYFKDLSKKPSGNSTESISINWQRFPDQRREYPAWRDPLLRGYGMQFTWFKNDPASGYMLIWRGLVLPSWLVILCLSVIPSLWLRGLLRRRRVQRWLREGRCIGCGFDRRAHKPTDKCPECGTIPEAPKKAAKAPERLISGG